MNIDTSEIMISKAEIENMVDDVATRINNTYSGELVVIGVLTGAFVFTADLVRKLKMPVIVDFIQVSSYVGTNSTGVLNVKKDISVDVKGKDVLIVEDIVDTGRTLEMLRNTLEGKGASSVRICTAINKPERRVVELEPDFNGFTIEDKFIVGYGLDYNGLYREYEDIRIVKLGDN